MLIFAFMGARSLLSHPQFRGWLLVPLASLWIDSAPRPWCRRPRPETRRYTESTARLSCAFFSWCASV